MKTEDVIKKIKKNLEGVIDLIEKNEINVSDLKIVCDQSEEINAVTQYFIAANK